MTKAAPAPLNASLLGVPKGTAAPASELPAPEIVPSKVAVLPHFAWIMPLAERGGGAGRSWRDHTSGV